MALLFLWVSKKLILCYIMLISFFNVVDCTKEMCSRGCELPPKKGTVITGTGTYSKVVGRQCPSQKAMIRHFVDVEEADGIDVNLQNEIDRAPFNLENTVVEFMNCQLEEERTYDLSDYDFSDLYKYVKRSNVTTNLRRVNGRLEDVSGTGGLVSTNNDITTYRVTRFEEITELPDSVSLGDSNVLKIENSDWMVYDNVTGEVKRSPVLSSSSKKDGFIEFDFTGLGWKNTTEPAGWIGRSGDKLEPRFPFFGGEYSKAFLSSNGYITFGDPADDYEGTIQGLFSKPMGNQFASKSTAVLHRYSRRPLLLPRISGFYTDLEPETNRTDTTKFPDYSGMSVTLMKVKGATHNASDARVVVTFKKVPLDTSITGRDVWEDVTFQIALFPNTGMIRIAWGGMSKRGKSVIGISPGIRPLTEEGTEDFEQINLRDYFDCVDNPYCTAEDETTVRLIGPSRPSDPDVYIYGLRETITLGLTKVHPFAVAQDKNPDVYNKFCSAGCTFYYTEGNWIQYLESLSASATATPAPTMPQPTSQPTVIPTSRPTPTRPSPQPTPSPPTPYPTIIPTRAPVPPPSPLPIPKPTRMPSPAPSQTFRPTAIPIPKPSAAPSSVPLPSPTPRPSHKPSSIPTLEPSKLPTRPPSPQPTSLPSLQPSPAPSVTPVPSLTATPTKVPTRPPTPVPTPVPSKLPTPVPSLKPTSKPTQKPTYTEKPSNEPTTVYEPLYKVAHNTSTLRSCLDRCDYTYRYNITVGGISGGYNDVAEVARLECWDGCQIANLLCQPGYYCFEGKMMECPPGTYRDASYDRVESCYLCPKGRYRDETAGRNVDMCKLCPIGKYANYTGSDSVSDCQRCPAGKVGLTAGIFKCTCITADSCKGDRPEDYEIATLALGPPIGQTPDGVKKVLYEVREEKFKVLRELRDSLPFTGRF